MPIAQVSDLAVLIVFFITGHQTRLNYCGITVIHAGQCLWISEISLVHEDVISWVSDMMSLEEITTWFKKCSRT